jgi:hypothetical protein
MVTLPSLGINLKKEVLSPSTNKAPKKVNNFVVDAGIKYR